MTTSRILRSCIAFLALFGALVGCDVQTFDDASSEFRNGSPPPPLPPPPGPPAPPPPPPPPPAFNAVFSEIQANVFTPSCASSSCHGAANAGSLNLEEPNSYGMLVNVAADQQAGATRVIPNNPAGSYLIQKMNGTAATGNVMPPGGALPQTTIDIVSTWIMNGALDDRPPPPVQMPVRITMMSVMPNSTLTAGPAQIVATFDQPVDATTVNLNTFLLSGSGDGIFNNGNDVSIAAVNITVPVGNPQTAVFDLTGVVLADDIYRISLLGNGASIIMDLNGMALDGEFFGLYPTGNGTAGGDFSIDFTVQTPVVIGPTLDQIQAVVFGPSCATVGCHTGPAGGPLPGGMDLSNANASFMNLVGIASVQDPLMLRVTAGDPNNSYLIRKIEGVAGFGLVMPPPPNAPLDPTVIAEIRQWITDGALR